MRSVRRASGFVQTPQRRLALLGRILDTSRLIVTYPQVSSYAGQ